MKIIDYQQETGIVTVQLTTEQDPRRPFTFNLKAPLNEIHKWIKLEPREYYRVSLLCESIFCLNDSGYHSYPISQDEYDSLYYFLKDPLSSLKPFIPSAPVLLSNISRPLFINPIMALQVNE